MLPAGTQDQQNYVNLRGLRCPACAGGNLISAALEQREDGEIRQSVHCQDCGTAWTDVYRLAGFADLTKTQKEG